MTTINVARVVPGLMAITLVGQSTKMLPKKWGGKTNKKDTLKFLKGFSGIVIGVPLVGATSNIVAKL